MRVFPGICIFFLGINIYSQDSIIEFDRPGAADLPYLVPQRTIQIEAGYGFGVDDAGDLGFDNSPSFLVRVATSKIFEMRIAINYLPLNTHFSRYYSANDMFGFGIGGKIKICNEKKARPELAITGLVTFSNQSFKENDPEPFGGEINLLANNFLLTGFILTIMQVIYTVDLNLKVLLVTVHVLDLLPISMLNYLLNILVLSIQPMCLIGEWMEGSVYFQLQDFKLMFLL